MCFFTAISQHTNKNDNPLSMTIKKRTYEILKLTMPDSQDTNGLDLLHK